MTATDTQSNLPSCYSNTKVFATIPLDLIPYNQTTVTETMVPSSHTRIKAFCRIIHNAGISVNIRTQFGSDINAACGQLAGAYRDDQNKEREQTLITSANLSYHGQEGNIELGTLVESRKISKQVDDIFTHLIFRKLSTKYK